MIFKATSQHAPPRGGVAAHTFIDRFVDIVSVAGLADRFC